MRKYTVLAVLTIQAGAILGLTKAQASARKHALQPLQVDKKGDGTFKVLSPVQFKVGEEISTDADLNKQLAAMLESAEETTRRERAADRARADAAAVEELQAKAKQWDEVQEELQALRTFLSEIEALPKELLEQVKAAVEKQRAPADPKK